ncbi:GNAT family N-acetyltransferase [Vibrio sp. FNV 38]|nr:GNAT family N-acetyltransferase [Vibrio sp. FNV 38]
MNTVEVMNEYNTFERQRVNAFNGQLETNNNVTRFVSEDENGSYISYFNFDPAQADAIIKQQVRYFQAKDLRFEWKTYSTDTPAHLGSVLLQNGFEQEDTESFMVLDLASAPNQPFDDAIITQVSDSQGIRDAITVQENVWGGDFEWQYHYLLQLKTQTPDSISIYVIYVDGTPVTSAWIIFNGDSPFAGIWGGSTVKAHRGNGHYRALLNKRIAEAKSRGLKYLTIDASEMSQPIVAKRGFIKVATTTGYTSPNHCLYARLSLTASH